MMTRATEKYYTVAQVAGLLEFGPAWVIERARAGDFGPGVLFFPAKQAGRSGVTGGAMVRGDYRIPASGLNAFIERNRALQAVDLEPIAARTAGELVRKEQQAA